MEIVLDHLTWTPDGRREPTLRDVTCRIPPGARVALLGPSGAGKSTLLQALAGVLSVSGTGVLTGSVTAPTAGLVLQDPVEGIVAETVGRDVAFGPENLGLPRDEIWSRVDGALSGVGLGCGLDRPTRALSGGQQQRLQLAGALAMRPSLLLLDEPTAMLDEAAASQVRTAVAATLSATGATMVLVEHRIGPWLEMLDHAILLSADGAVVACGPLPTVLATHRDELIAAGVWLPDLTAPTPVPAPPGTGDVSDGTLLTCARPAVRRGGVMVGGADFEVRAGDVVALTGASGTGKSTTLDLVLGMLTPDTGTVTPDPVRRSSRELAAAVAHVPQHPGLGFTSGTVREELLRTPLALGRSADHRADELLEHFGLSALAGASPHSLSGGEQRRLSLAVALMAGASLLVLDEPSVGQDRHTWALVAGVVVGAGRSGAGAVLATHDADLIALASHRVTLSAPRAVNTSRPATRPAAARCRPLALLTAALLTAVASPAISTPAAALAALVAIVMTMPLYRSPWRVMVRRAAPVLVAALTVGWSSWLLGGHDAGAAGVAVARILFMVLPGALLMAHVEPSALGDDLAQRLRLPARPVMAAVVSLQRVDRLRDTWQRIASIRRLRGLAPGRFDVPGRARWSAGLTFALLVDSLRSAGATAAAMDARGFAAASRRTWALPAPWGRAEWVAVVIAGACVVAMMTVARWGG